MTEFELGNQAYLAGDYNKAKELYTLAIEKDPSNVVVYHNLGLTYSNLGLYQAALDHLKIPIEHNYSESYLTRGAIKRSIGDYDGALVDFLKAIYCNPKNSNAYSNYGNSLREFGLPDLAIPFLQKAQEQDSNPMHRLNESVAHLLRGDWLAGWQKYDARWFYESDKNTKPVLLGEEYNGKQDVLGKVVLVYGEQGFGDIIQFCRFVSLIQQQGGNVVLAIRKPLIQLIQNSFPSVRVVDSSDEIPSYSYHVPLLELPNVFNITPNNIPMSSKYLESPHDSNIIWKTRLLDIRKPRVGIVWNSNRNAYISRFKRIDLDEMLQGIHTDNCEWVSLYTEATQDEKEILKKYNVHSFDEDLTNFAETAALIQNLDLVITIDTAVAHLAGALGVKTWVMLPNYAVDWRWLLERRDSPFYSSMLLYRQNSTNTWKNVLVSIKNDLSLLS